jgi:hypothetical protein
VRRLGLFSLLLCAACGSEAEMMGAGGDAGPTPIEARQEALISYPSYRDLHEAVVTPMCGPRGGVCHNSKQFPDLHTPENMLASVGVRCNQLTDDPIAIVDLCEPRGDLLVIKSGANSGFRTRIGFLAPKDPMEMAPTDLEITLRDPLPHTATGANFAIVRDVDPQSPIEVPVGFKLSTKEGEHKATIVGFASLSTGLKAFLYSRYMPGYSGQVLLGDPNRNGTFGYERNGATIKPGKPELSFFVQRITGEVPPKMPLANGELTAPQLYALQCWIAQMSDDGSNADGPIDYSKCPLEFPKPFGL